jgi:hypothetical protein
MSKATETIKYRCFNIKYDTDGHKVKLPKEIIVEVDKNLNEDELEETLSDSISDKTGFCHMGFDSEIFTK